MKYELGMAKNWCNEEDKIKLEKLGFRFELETDYHKENPEYKWYCENSFSPKDLYIEINSLEELNDFIKKYGNIVIEEGKLIIYNGYLE